MKILVTPDVNGVISRAGQIVGIPVDAGAVLCDLPSSGVDLPPNSAARVTDGVIEIIPNWVGSGPWYDKDAGTSDRLTAIEITEIGVSPSSTWAMSPRPETRAEKTARETAEAEAAAAEARTKIMALVASSVQFAQACALTGIITREEAVAWAASGTLPQVLATAIAAIPDETARFAAEIKAAGAVTYERASPVVAGLGAALGKSEADLDALFQLAVTL